MTSFTDAFGGSTLQAAQVAYRAVALAASAVLKWPPYATANDYLARIMDVSPSVASLTLTLPDANLASTGLDAFFNNKGANSFSLLDSAGGVIAVIAPGTVRYAYLSDNSTAAGTWVSILMGVGSSTLDASQLAGLGLKAINNTLAQAAPVTAVTGSTALTTASRAQVYVWTGGTGTLTLPALATIGSDWFFEVRNQGTGVLALAPVGGELIDASATVQLQLNESCFVHAGPTAWYTVGRGRNAQFNFSLLTKTVTGGTSTLSLTEAANVVQSYIGVLLSNQVVVLPAVVQVYYVSNNTTGAFSLTFRNPAAGTTVSVPTGQSAILFGDGVNVINASTTVAGLTSLNLAAGSAASPSLSLNTTNTGLYSSGTSQVGVSANGVQVAQFDSTGFRTTSAGASTNQSVSTAAGANLLTDRPAGQIGRVGWRTSGLNRWAFDANTTAEAGANAGSDFTATAYDDAGASLGTAFTIARASRIVSFTVAPSGPGGTFVDLNSVQTLTNKSLTNPIITGSTGTAALNTLSLLTPLPLTSGGTGSTTAANARTNLGVPDSIQTQQYTAFTTGGTSTAYTLTTVPAQGSYVAGQRYRVNLHTPNGATPTLNRDGLGAKNIKQYDSTGAKVAPAAAGLPTLFDVEYDGTDMLVLDPLPPTTVADVGIAGQSRNLKASLTANGANITFTADQVDVSVSLAGASQRLASYSQTLSTGGTGAGGMDTGAIPTSGFLAVYAIAKADGTASILGVNAATSTGSIYSGANMPAGYTYSALIGIVPTNATPQLLACLIQDRHIDVVPIGIVVGGTLSGTLTTQSISVGVPVAAKTADLQFINVTGGAFKYQSAGNANGIGIQASAGAQDVSSRTSGGGMSSGYAACNHKRVPLITAQTVFVASLGSGGADSLYVTGYDI